ncbi:putative membrane protein yhdu [Enterobacter sp. FY-07]|nr:putative membrane protein yhdu [Enterobacter sp. FY-07]
MSCIDKKALTGMGKRLFYCLKYPTKPRFPRLFTVVVSCIFSANGCKIGKHGMIRKYWWLVAFALSILILDVVIMQWIEYLTTEMDKCRNMNSVNPLKLVNCESL